MLGFVGMDPVGLEGIEAVYNEALSGHEGFRKTTKDGRARELMALGERQINERNGYDLVLTIDEKIQYITERELWYMYEQHRPLSASVIVIQPKTGEILSLANVPSLILINIFTHRILLAGIVR